MRLLLLSIFVFTFSMTGRSQTNAPAFDTALFNKQLELANHLIEYEFYTQTVRDKFNKQPETADLDWFSFQKNNLWHSIGGHAKGTKFIIKNHVTTDSNYNISEYKGIADTAELNSLGTALAIANSEFRVVRDTCQIYLNSFVICNPDHTISIWYLPAFQPSGQAIYGCEWEYMFDNEGRNLIGQNSYTGVITGIWIGQPRELWLNYRNTDRPTAGSVFFALSFRDYFTRIRIDTRLSISTTSKEAKGNYTWTHKMK